MNRDEIVMLLAYKEGFDDRPFDEADVFAWYEVLKGSSLEDAKEAVARHFSTSEKRLYPVDVVKGITRLREVRLRQELEPVPDVDPDDVAGYLQALRENRRAIAEGRHGDVRALPTPQGPPRPDRALTGPLRGAES